MYFCTIPTQEFYLHPLYKQNIELLRDVRLIYTPKKIKQESRLGGIYFVILYQEDTVISIARCVRSGGTVTLTHMATAKKYRNQKYATKLFTYIMDQTSSVLVPRKNKNIINKLIKYKYRIISTTDDTVMMHLSP